MYVQLYQIILGQLLIRRTTKMENFPETKDEKKRKEHFLQEADLEKRPIFSLLSFSLPQTINEKYQESEIQP